MEIWRSESASGKQNLLIFGCIIVGAIIVNASYGKFVWSNFNDAGAAFLLGCLLLVIGLFSILYAGKQSIIIDPNNKNIIVENVGYFISKKKVIIFSDINDVGVGYLGKRSNFVNFYYLILHLNDGKTYSLFSPGYFYADTGNEAAVNKMKERLLEYINNHEK